jgi:DNA-binding response OmpR family regulator/S1-C subfamily serine protease
VDSRREKILILEGDEPARQSLQDLLQASGHEVLASGSCEEGLKIAGTQGVDLVLLDTNLSGQICGDLVAAFKGASATANVRVILLTPGGPPERARSLDLGADDVVSRPWDEAELRARVRLQLRNKKAQDDLREKMTIAEEGQHMLGTAFQALAVTEKMTRDAFTLGRGLKIGLAVGAVVVAAMAAIYFSFSRRATKETQRSYAVIARLNRGLSNQEALVERARKLNETMAGYAANSAQGQKEQLEQQSRELRARMAQAPSQEAGQLRTQLQKTEERMRQVATESSQAEGIIRTYAPSVCLIHVAVGFKDQPTDRPLRYVGLTPDGQPIHDSKGNPLITLEGTGPEVRADFLGTGFLVTKDGRILTNHHVAEPWWKSDDLRQLTEQGLQPSVVEMVAYFPGSPHAYALRTEKISAEADVAVVRGDLGGLDRKVVGLDGRKEASASGEGVVLMGYATGLDAVLARADESTVRSIVTESNGDVGKILARLAQKELIRPIVTQGHIGDVLADKIVYDAQTTSGGSGGPLFNPEGKAIGINYAMLEDFGGSNFGIPARYAERLLAR